MTSKSSGFGQMYHLYRELMMDSHIEAGVRINDFKVIKILGTGGMGIVYLAMQMSLNRPVALKILGPTIDDPRGRARFRRESCAVALLKHHGIAEVYYAGQVDTLCFMATEYIDGATLRQVFSRLAATQDASITVDSLVQEHEIEVERPEIRFDIGTDESDDSLLLDEGGDDKAGSITPEAEKLIGSKDYARRWCMIVRDAAFALEHAHDKGVVHRDIKPENLMLDRKGGVHLIDFGVARFRDDAPLSQSGALVGTPMYMSPEHIAGRVNVDHRSDIFSLGIVLYEALSLRPPYSAQTREGIFRQIVNKAMPPLSARNRAVSRELEAVVHKAIARDPEERYPTADAFAYDLQHVIDGKPISARPYRYKFDKREIAAERPVGVTVAAFLYFFVLMFCGIAVAGYGLNPTESMQKNRIEVNVSIFILLIMIGSFAYFVGYGLVAAKRSALVLASLVSGSLACMILRDILINPIAYFRTTLGTLFMWGSLLACVASLIVLNRPSTWKWARNAAILRSEHRQLARSR